MNDRVLNEKESVELIAQMIQNTKSVSYTHLDVYKRQAVCCCPEVRMRLHPNAIISSIAFCGFLHTSKACLLYTSRCV